MELGLTVACITEAFLMASLHWFPWTRALGKKVKPPWSYVAGCAALGLVYSGWLLLAVPDPGWCLVGWWAITGAGGGMDLLAYGLDRWLGLEMEARHGEDSGS